MSRQGYYLPKSAEKYLSLDALSPGVVEIEHSSTVDNISNSNIHTGILIYSTVFVKFQSKIRVGQYI